MLVLNRRPRQAVVIGEDITVRILGIADNGGVKLGVDAPEGVVILREELLAGEVWNE